MLYLLDANVLIDANRDYYPIARVPEFWEWLEHNGAEGHIKLPPEIHEEIKAGKKNNKPDELAKWAKGVDLREALLLKEEADPARPNRAFIYQCLQGCIRYQYSS